MRAQARRVLPFMGTRDSARDMDLVRAALGEEQIAYLGFSYGTALGASYASLYPERVRAMVLDGAIEPSFDLLAFAREQAVAVEGALSAYDAEAATKGWHGVDVLEAVTARAEATPIPGGGEPRRVARASDILYGSVEALASPDEWHALASALGAAQAGDGAPFIRLSDRYFQRGADGVSALRVEAQLAVLCADLHGPVSPEAYRDAIPEIRRASPHVGVANLMSLLPCAFWVEPAEASGELRAEPGPPILVVAGSRDPLTPAIWGVRLSERLGGSARLDVESDVHTAYGNGDDCTRRIVERVFVERELPESPARCP
jgi:pimeloyl-ACP methyl ester carboxylesterase